MTAKRKQKKRNISKKKNGFGWLIALMVVTVALIVAYFQLEDKPSFKEYSAFGIFMPTDYTIHGIDVSRHQGVINWDLVQKMDINHIRISFAFMKATEGVQSVDPAFARNWRETKRVKISRGAYHFFLPNKDGVLQAKNFIRTVRLERGDLPPVVDIEELYGTPPPVMRKELIAFINTIEKYYQVKPIIYTYKCFYEDYLDGHFDKYPLWIAHYLRTSPPQLHRDWLFWQHSEQGNVDGIATKTDFNVFYGNRELFKELLIK